MSKASFVSVDDDPGFQMFLSEFLRVRGYELETLTSGDQLLARLAAGPSVSVILLDVMLPDGDGIQIIERMRAAGFNVPIIMISGVGLVKSVVEAMKLGATDFLRKPFEEAEFEKAIENVLQSPARIPASGSATTAGSEGLVSVNETVLRMADVVKRVAPTDVPILILGESGVGKEVMARHAHAHSGRGSKPFIKVNCAALPHELLESELFGYDRGAFTGALTDKPGKFELAHTGTLLLDEIGEMSAHLQSKLLHVLQDGVFTRVGGRKPMRVDARIIATTNIKMAEAIAAGRFREDLYFRLNVITLELPPLRERREDIPALCEHFMSKYRERYNRDGRELTPELLNRLVQYDWPGNIRQLENCIKQFLVLPDRYSLLSEFSSTDKFRRDPIQAPGKPAAAAESFSLLDVGAVAADRAERELVRRILQETNGNRKQAAKRMNVCYKALLNKMKRWTNESTSPFTEVTK
jgi:two-component system, NtrC family, response regulator AtoC